jgi:hypothetical protein
LALAGACALFLVQGWLSLLQKGPAYDEVAHLGAAHDYVSRRVHVLNVEHPPLVKHIVGFALAPLRLEGRAPAPPLPGTLDIAAHWRAEQWLCGKALLVDLNGDRMQRILTVSRTAILLGCVPLLICLGLWVRYAIGPAAALVTLWLAAFSPNLLANAQLIHTDFTLTVFVTLTLAQLWRMRGAFDWSGAAALGLLWGLAMSTKYSGVLLGPIMAAVAVVDTLRRRNQPTQSDAAPVQSDRAKRLLHWAAVGAVATAVAAVAVSLCTGRFDPGWWIRGQSTLFKGLVPGYERYCAGVFSADGFWHYFLLALVVKLPLAAIILMAIGVIGLLRLEPSRRADMLIFILLPAALYFGCASATRMNLGIRYVLPVFPLLFALGGLGGQWLWSQRIAGRILLVALLAAHAGESLWRAPGQMGFFNVAAGGPRRGHHWLDDSNVDWGQDLPAVSEWRSDLLNREPDAEVVILHFGYFPAHTMDPSAPFTPKGAYNFEVALPACDRLVISQHMIPRTRHLLFDVWGVPVPWLEDRHISEWVRNGYAVFRFEEADDGDVLIVGDETLRIPREQWVSDGFEAADRVESWFLARPNPRVVERALLRWQTAKFAEKWATPEEADARWRDLRSIVERIEQSAAGFQVEQSLPFLWQDLIAHER